MKRIKEKFRRTVKYLRVSYKQASLDERMLMGMGALVMLVYAWWVVVVL
jgi:type II secretory pathway component PulM